MPTSPVRPAPTTDLAARYPSHRGRRAAIVALIVALAALGLGWTIWTGYVHANPPVAGRIKAWTVASDTQTDVTLTVDRTDPGKAYRCSVYAQSTNFERVGEVTVDVPPAGSRVVDVPITIKTFRRATSVSFDTCAAA